MSQATLAPPLPQTDGPAIASADAPGSPRVARRLEIPPYDHGAARRLESELGLSHVLAQILTRRGLADPAAARAFLEAGERHDPAGFAGIDAALTLIRDHLTRGSRITVHGDYDVDGVCATAIMVRALRSLGGSVDWFLPSRIDDGYGLSAATVDRLVARGTGLLLTVDCAITAVEEVAAARAAGLDVVVTDHHAPRADGQLPAAPIVHPALCGYPCPELCGTGVAYKLAGALGAATAEEDLDLVALATVADLVALRGENRSLVREGLRALAASAKPGVRALMAVSRTDPGDLDAGTVAFRLAPRINAAGRLFRADAGVELLLTADEGRARAIALELDAANHERRQVEQRITWEAEALVAELGERPAYVLAAEGWHPGVIGIVASRIVERHHRPAVMVALEGAEGTGSGRSISGFDLLAGLHACAGPLARYGGHRAAAGLTIAADRVAEFQALLEAHAASVLTPELLVPSERIDAVVSVSELGLGLAEELERLEPCGMANPAPRLLVTGGRFEDLRPMGEGERHLRFSIVSGGSRARGVSFGCDGRLPVDPASAADATFTLKRNVWNGAVEPQLVLRHAQPPPRRPIEVIGEPESYLVGTLREFEAPLAAAPQPRPLARDGGEQGGRTVVDRRHESPLAVLADTVATGEPVLALCGDVCRRLPGLSGRSGGFALAAHHALERDPALADDFMHIVVLDPPSSEHARGWLRAGSGYTHLCWGEAELRFAQQMHELEFGLRTPLGALYRGLRSRQRAAGEELEHLLRGDRRPGRPARLAGRLIRVLAELELVSLDRYLPAVAIAGAGPTALERSPAFRAYTARYEDGQRFLNRANLRRSA